VFGSTLDIIDSDRIDSGRIDYARINFERIDLCLDTIRGVRNRTNPIEKPQTNPIHTETAKKRTWFG